MADSHPIENWRPVVGREGEYEVSDFGRVRSLDRIVECWDGVQKRWPGRVLRVSPAGNGYLQVQLGAKGRKLKVYHLVLEAFVGPRSTGAECAHLDGNRSNNALRNLMWATKAQNQQHKVGHGTLRFGVRHPNRKLNDDLVRQIRRLAADGMNCGQIGRELGLPHSTVYKVMKGITWAHVTS